MLMAAQTPLLETDPSAQRLQQLPQSAGLLAVFTQRPPQLVVPPGLTQTPPLHSWVLPQVVPQAPQLPALVARGTQEPPQLVVPAAQVAAQRPRLHTCPAAQAV